ncbi:DNA polymerase III subunit delta' [Mycoplasma sp. 'Moose RK']|uniref:DNA polymerase III subunit delta' n=1 Tax=Mycoplasma sp. 'Moose RK' TaxID=2780095 RepID=UPI0018C1DF85|nr:DNA polymerase III subunit delta' [Mycoplasma sp. 'Moose RK']MBG0730985.1 DNA polymerase III subunit delta' [Mycoplasma sp. 'Moose RK']
MKNWNLFLDNLSKNQKIPHAILLISHYSEIIDQKIIEFSQLFEKKYEIYQLDILDKSISKSEFVEEINKLYYSSISECDLRIFVLKNVEKANIFLLNSILKVLEEPPNSSYFLLTAKNKNLILPTIASRCQIFSFNEFDQTNRLEKKLNSWRENRYNFLYAEIFTNFEEAKEAISKIQTADLDKFELLFSNIFKNRFEFLLFLNQLISKENAIIFVQILIFYIKAIFSRNLKNLPKNFQKSKILSINYKIWTKMILICQKFLESIKSNENFNLQKSAFLVRLNVILS